MRCYTAEQLDRIDQAVQRQFEQFLVAPNLQNPANLNGSRFATGGSISGGVLPASLTLTKSTTNTYPLAMAEP